MQILFIFSKWLSWFYWVNFFSQEKSCNEEEVEASYMAANISKKTFFVNIYQICHRRTVVAPALILNSCSHLQTESTEIEGLWIQLVSFVVMVPQVQDWTWHLALVWAEPVQRINWLLNLLSFKGYKFTLLFLQLIFCKDLASQFFPLGSICMATGKAILFCCWWS